MLYKKPSLNRNKRKFEPLTGLPSHYPIPEDIDDLLFYIQRNHNLNTIIYKINRDQNQLINESQPLCIQWIRYDDNGEIKELSFMQNKLAYGCQFTKINNHSYKFHFVSYPSMIFYLGPKDNGYAVFYKNMDKLIQLSNVYVHADEFGLFPDVKFIELYGTQVENGQSVIQKIKL
jgi:hypothetical protein